MLGITAQRCDQRPRHRRRHRLPEVATHGVCGIVDHPLSRSDSVAGKVAGAQELADALRTHTAPSCVLVDRRRHDTTISLSKLLCQDFDAQVWSTTEGWRGFDTRPPSVGATQPAEESPNVSRSKVVPWLATGTPR